MKKILKSLFTLSVVGLLLVGATRAFFSDTETSANNRFVAGAIDLLIDNTSYYNGQPNSRTTWGPSNLSDGQGPADGAYLFFEFDDLKPGDWGEDTISLRVNDNHAYACMDFTLTSNSDNTSVEPELEADDDLAEPNNLWDGELAQNLFFVWWADDGDNVLEDDEAGEGILYQGSLWDMGFDSNYNVTIPLADSVDNIWGETYMEGEKTYYVGKAWCFGGFELAPVTQDGSNNQINPTGEQGPGIICDPEGDHNMAQTDRITANIRFYAEQQRHNESFRCIDCENVGPGFATNVVSNVQGLRKNGSAVLPERSNPNDVLGSPDGAFHSLGYGGEVVVEFADKVFGDTLSVISVHEITNGRDTYPEEKVDVFVSQNGTDWVSIGTASNQDSDGGDGVALLDVYPSGYNWIRYVKLVDTTDSSLHDNVSDGFDIDAIDASHICLDNSER